MDKRVEKRFIKYSNILSIHPFLFSFGKKIKYNSVGFRFILSKQKNRYFAGEIQLIGENIRNMPYVLELLKNQMKDLWKEKYKINEPIFYGKNMKKPKNITQIIESGKLIHLE
jgi:hypothetical protein